MRSLLQLRAAELVRVPPKMTMGAPSVLVGIAGPESEQKEAVVACLSAAYDAPVICLDDHLSEDDPSAHFAIDFPALEAKLHQLREPQSRPGAEESEAALAPSSNAPSAGARVVLITGSPFLFDLERRLMSTLTQLNLLLVPSEPLNVRQVLEKKWRRYRLWIGLDELMAIWRAFWHRTSRNTFKLHMDKCIEDLCTEAKERLDAFLNPASHGSEGTGALGEESDSSSVLSLSSTSDSEQFATHPKDSGSLGTVTGLEDPDHSLDVGCEHALNNEMLHNEPSVPGLSASSLKRSPDLRDHGETEPIASKLPRFL